MGRVGRLKSGRCKSSLFAIPVPLDSHAVIRVAAYDAEKLTGTVGEQATVVCFNSFQLHRAIRPSAQHFTATLDLIWSHRVTVWFGVHECRWPLSGARIRSRPGDKY